MLMYLKIMKFPVLFAVFSQVWTGFFLVIGLNGNIAAGSVLKMLLCSTGAAFLYAASAIFAEIYGSCINRSKNTVARSDSFLITMLVLLLTGLLITELAGLWSLVLASLFVFIGLFGTVYEFRFWPASVIADGLIFMTAFLLGISFMENPFAAHTATIIFAMLITAVFASITALLESREIRGMNFRWTFGSAVFSGLIFFITYIVMPQGERIFVTILVLVLMIVWYMFSLKPAYTSKEMAAMTSMGPGMLIGLNAVILFSVARNTGSLMPPMAAIGMAAGYGLSSFLLAKIQIDN